MLDTPSESYTHTHVSVRHTWVSVRHTWVSVGHSREPLVDGGRRRHPRGPNLPGTPSMWDHIVFFYCLGVYHNAPDSGARQYKSRIWKRRFGRWRCMSGRRRRPPREPNLSGHIRYMQYSKAVLPERTGLSVPPTHQHSCLRAAPPRQALRERSENNSLYPVRRTTPCTSLQGEAN